MDERLQPELCAVRCSLLSNKRVAQTETLPYVRSTLR